MRFRAREMWPLAAGVAAAAAVLLLFALASDGVLRALPLGVSPGGWALAFVLLAAFVALQFRLRSRESLQRERRLVDTAAALREATARLRELATTDPLTGLLNRRDFFERLGLEFRRSRRYGRSLSLLMIDIDDFKRVNDTHGHQVGDEVLVSTAVTLHAGVRESDLVARYGGEEFVVMLPETRREDAVALAGRLREAVGAMEIPVGAAVERVTVSIGVAGFPADAAEDEDELVRLADSALYAAKGSGKDRVILAGEPPAKRSEGPAGA